MYREYECITCGAAKSLAWYHANGEEARARQRKRYAENLEDERRAARESYRRHKDRHAERHRERQREWRRLNREADAAAARNWRAANPEHARLLAKARRARVRGAQTEVVRAADIDALLKRQRGKCAVCKCAISKDRKHIDHRMPLAKGGKHEVRNFDLLCPRCNLTKSSKHPIDFMRARGLLL